ncbi:hypothetical protein J0895_09740 [Phormidium pseudopriestleyi FRX01]|uniref:ZIP Zinc transporter n=1 Tax=Phormidium pseudopriestleyi FRX01 TaxID=1759528 RepID=A0ABS3FRA0_9CYAN|nr:hypothetical protein [Phormidium pseudopriestleyi]MBO0349382.1 hypothetical protein [Phormidium pseudopriestleyi FRX01]
MVRLSLLLAIALALIHICAGNLRVLETIPRSRWLSVAGGVSVAYVFIHIFPELSAGQIAIEEANLPVLDYLEHHVYLMSLLGFSLFYGLERLAKKSRENQRKTGRGDITSEWVFWIHISSFAVYNVLIGYLLLHREEPGLWSLVLFFIAMALHFIVNDFGLREHHKHSYQRRGRWVLAAAAIAGWMIGSATEISEAAIAVLFAFLAGGVILNILKEELPEERESRFWAFAAGATVYAALLLAL